MQQFRTKFQSIWIEESIKIVRIKEFLKEKTGLADIRSEFENIQIKFNEVEEEPSSIEIGPFEIVLGKYNLTYTIFTRVCIKTINPIKVFFFPFFTYTTFV